MQTELMQMQVIEGLTYFAAPSERDSIRAIATLPRHRVAIIMRPGPITIV